MTTTLPTFLWQLDSFLYKQIQNYTITKALNFTLHQSKQFFLLNKMYLPPRFIFLLYKM